MGRTDRGHADEVQPTSGGPYRGRTDPLGLRPLLLGGLLVTLPALASEYESLDSLEALMSTEVTSVSKKAQPVGESAAAVFVITREEIRRSGATSVPEVLRLAPGVNAAHIGNDRWGVSIRGDVTRFSNKLLVLLDGRPLYVTLFGGVLWEEQNIPLTDIERIEVIRGPGAALWGSNAVNGVINIITRHAGDSQGLSGALLTGNEERATLTLREGYDLGEERYLRLSLHARHLDSSRTPWGGDAEDEAKNYRFDGRWDGPLAHGQATFSASLSHSRLGEQAQQWQLTPPWGVTQRYSHDTRLATLGGDWRHLAGSGAEWMLSGYLDYTDRDVGFFASAHQIVDLELQRHEAQRGAHDWVWGLGYRLQQDDYRPSTVLDIDHAGARTALTSLFVQDEIDLVPQHWSLILGARVEHEAITGSQLQPNVRVLWRPTPNDALWASVARASRTLSVGENFVRYRFSVIPPGTPLNPGPLPLELMMAGTGELEAERLTAFELGYRGQLGPKLLFESVAFIHHYSHMLDITDPQVTDLFADRVVATSYFVDGGETLRAQGVELGLDWRPRPDWKLATAYTYMDGHPDTMASYTPNQLSLRLAHDLSDRVEADLWLRYTSAYRGGPVQVDAVSNLDLRLGWQVDAHWALSLVGQNLLRPRDEEMTSPYFGFLPAEVERSVYLKAAWQVR